jgi:hypothetical protein
MGDLSFVDRLKLRTSWGEVGNDQIGGDFYLYQARFGITSNATDPAYQLDDLGNPLLQWETIENFDVALEFGLFNNLFDGSIEYYRRNSTDLLFDLPLQPSVGINVQPNNIADMYNSGFEFSLTTNAIETDNFNWSFTTLASTLKNEITSIPDPVITGSKRWAEGISRFDFFLRRTAGVDPATGDQLFYVYEFDENNESVPVLDANGNHEITNDWQETERAYTGDSSIPDLIGSFQNSLRYKNFTLDFLVTYQLGGKIIDYAYAGMMNSSNFGRSQHPDILNAWRQPGDITNVPRLENGNQDLVITLSDRFLTDASYVSLRNVSFGYTFDDSITESLGIDNLSLSLTGENLLLLTKRDGLDPQYNLAGTQSGDDFNPARIFSIGLNVGF